MKQLKKTLLTLVALLAVTTGAWATDVITVTWNPSDIVPEHTGDDSFTKDGITFTAATCDFQILTFRGGGTFTTTLGNFTKIEISADFTGDVSGTGWSNDGWQSATWTGNAASVSFSGDIWGGGMTCDGGNLTIVFTIEESPAIKVAWDKAKKTGTFTMPGGNVTLEPEYYPQAALTAAPTAINDVPATTDGAIVKAGTVANIGETTTAQGTVMYYVSPTALDDAALLALAADQWTADVPTAKSLAQGQAYVYYYVRGNDSNNDAENFSDGDILAANALTVTIAAEPTYAVTFAEGTDPNEWTASPNADVKKGQTVTVTYTGTKKVIGVKAEKKAAASGTPLDNTTTAWSAGTYAVPAGGLTYSDAITVSGDVTLVLTDGETLTLNKGISLASGATLTIQGNGTMNVNGTNGADNNTREFEASADSGTEAISGSGTVVLTSGTLTATGGKGGNVDDYMPECKGGHGAAGISCTLIVNGGTVTATGGNGGSLTNGFGPLGVAGNGGAGISGALTVNGGTLTATGGDGGAKSNGPETQAGTNGRGISSTWTAGTGITFSDSANGTSWTTNSGTSSTQKYVKAE